ncbi:Receptor-type tyrosine-protein phosphatase C [Taenia crassiceps]|uniref:Receptor-type tyrosine-protein phosphatase C n=1 Tax=Taenia crassiceps TaxID=6207 RepID=A0ABR4QBY9_9CEST
MSRGYPVEGFHVYGWSTSGFETAIGVRKDRMFFMFDVGIAPACHGHIDHIGAICQHMRKRELNRLPPAVYYLLPQLVEPVRALCCTFSQLQGEEMDALLNPRLVEMLPGSTVELSSRWSVECFPTDHVVQSQGYILFQKNLQTGVRTPEIAYTGDTRFTIFTEPAHRDILRVKLLISEATYLDDNLRIKNNAEKYGHICIRQYADNASLFEGVGALFLIHFSNRYPVSVRFSRSRLNKVELEGFLTRCQWPHIGARHKTEFQFACANAAALYNGELARDCLLLTPDWVKSFKVFLPSNSVNACHRTRLQWVSGTTFQKVSSDYQRILRVITPEVPANLKVTNRTNKSIRVEWDLPSDVLSRSYNYIVYATLAEQTEGSNGSCFTVNTNGCNATNLSANTAYELVAIACFDQTNLCSNYTDPLLNYTKPGIPQNLRVKNKSAEGLMLTWSEPIPNTTNFSRYHVVVADGEAVFLTKSINTSEFNLSYSELPACRTVNFSVRICTRKADCGAFERLLVAPLPCDDTGLLKILLGIFIPLIIITLLVLLFVFRKRIPFLRDLFQKKPRGKDVNLTLFPIKYYTPFGAKSLSNVPPPIAIESFADSLQYLDEGHGFQTLSQSLALLTVLEVEEKYRLTKVAALQNGSRNRYGDMVPYDQSLVLVGRPWSAVLKDQEPRITVGEVEKGYINASYIRRSEYNSRGEALVSPFTTLPEYIAAQSPLESTVADFLTMVCEQRCPLIIMLSQCKEGGKAKCAQYWPDGVVQTFDSKKCSVEVRKESEESIGSVVRRQLRIHPSSEALPWSVTQLQFTGWPDYGVPSMESFYSLIAMQNSLLGMRRAGTECGPTVVHCSDGTGQTESAECEHRWHCFGNAKVACQHGTHLDSIAIPLPLHWLLPQPREPWCTASGLRPNPFSTNSADEIPELCGPPSVQRSGIYRLQESHGASSVGRSSSCTTSATTKQDLITPSGLKVGHIFLSGRKGRIKKVSSISLQLPKWTLFLPN